MLQIQSKDVLNKVHDAGQHICGSMRTCGGSSWFRYSFSSARRSCRMQNRASSDGASQPQCRTPPAWRAASRKQDTCPATLASSCIWPSVHMPHTVIVPLHTQIQDSCIDIVRAPCLMNAESAV